MWNTIARMNFCAGISVRLTADGLYASAVTVSRDGNRLELGKRLTGYTSLEAIMEALPKSVPVALNVTGRGIMQKRTEKLNAIDKDSLNRLIPGLQEEHFYTQHFISGGQSFVSLIRRTDAEQLLSQFTKKGFPVLQLSLGAFPADNILEQLNQYGESLTFDGWEVTFDEARNWLSVTYHDGIKSAFAVKIGIEEIDERLLLPYATAFQLLLHERLSAVQSAMPAMDAALEADTARRKLQRTGIATLLTMFLVLLINTLLFFHYNDANSRLLEELSKSSVAASDLAGLTSRVNQKENLVKKIGYGPGPSKAVMLDQAAALLPEDVTLSAITVNPASKAGMDGHAGFSDRQIAITGHSASVLPVNEWVARLRTLKWPKNVQLAVYGPGNGDELPQFTIYLNY